MARYRMDDGSTVVDTDRADTCWEGRQRFDGRNHVDVHTSDQWEHQNLYRSRRGRYYVEHWSQRQGTHWYAEWVSPQEAARWLLIQGLPEDELPEDLAQVVDEVSE